MACNAYWIATNLVDAKKQWKIADRGAHHPWFVAIHIT
jgi:hypothetical protein